MYCSQCGSKLNDNGVCEKCTSGITSDKKVKVIISRRSNFAGSAISYKVYVDGVEVTKLANGKSQEIMLSPGTHDFAFDMWSASNTEKVTIPDNCQEFYIDTMMEMGAITNKISIISASTEKPTSQNSQNSNQEGKMTVTAIIGLACGIIGLFIASLPFGIIAVSLGASALNHIKVFPNDKGKVLAIISIAIGVIEVVFGLIMISNAYS